MKPLYFLCLFLFPFFINAQEIYFPPNTTTTWETMSITDMGYCQDSIDLLYDFLEDNDSKAFLLLKDGKIVLEQYFGTFDADSSWYWASAGKTLTGFLVGIAQEEDLLSIDDATSDYLGTGWTSCTAEQEANILIRHQLSMTTGLNDGLGDANCTSSECLQYLAAPNERWAYHNGPYTLLDEVLSSATGQSLNLYLNAKIKTPIGMNGLYLQVGDNNVYFSNARSMARFGLLLLAEGVWDDTTILSDSDYFEAMTTSSQDLNLSYGYLTWLNGKTSFMVPQLQTVFNGSISTNAPTDAYFALGKNGQLINVVPSQNLVWIRMGNAPPNSNSLIASSLNDDIWAKINNLNCSSSTLEEVEQLETKIYPNPIGERLTIESQEKIASIKIFDASAKVIYNKNINKLVSSVDVSNFKKGLFILEIIYKNGKLGRYKILK